MTEPEQWAVEWHKVALIAQDHEDPCLNTALGSLYDAFEERERKLREEWEAERISLLQANCTLNSQLADYALKIRQALKDATHD